MVINGHIFSIQIDSDTNFKAQKSVQVVGARNLVYQLQPIGVQATIMANKSYKVERIYSVLHMYLPLWTFHIWKLSIFWQEFKLFRVVFMIEGEPPFQTQVLRWL